MCVSSLNGTCLQMSMSRDSLGLYDTEPLVRVLSMYGNCVNMFIAVELNRNESSLCLDLENVFSRFVHYFT